jgi:hypothetical protein
MNPQFFLNLSDPDPYDDERNCPVVISLLQQQETRKSEHAIGFKVYKCDLTSKSLDERFFAHNQPVRDLMFNHSRRFKSIFILMLPVEMKGLIRNLIHEYKFKFI